MGHGHPRDEFWDLSIGQFIAVFESVAVIAQRRAEAEAPDTAAAGAAPVGGGVQEARGMRHGNPGVARGGLGVPGQRPTPRSPARPGTRKGTAMDAMQIFGMLAGGS